MSKAYSVDLRERAVGAVEAGRLQVEVAELFKVSLATLKRWLCKRRAGQGLAPKVYRPGPPAHFGRLEVLAALGAQLAADPDGRLIDHCRRWHARTGRAVSVATMHRARRALAWTHKKSGSRRANATSPNGRAGVKHTPR